MDQWNEAKTYILAKRIFWLEYFCLTWRLNMKQIDQWHCVIWLLPLNFSNFHEIRSLFCNLDLHAFSSSRIGCRCWRLRSRVNSAWEPSEPPAFSHQLNAGHRRRCPYNTICRKQLQSYMLRSCRAGALQLLLHRRHLRRPMLRDAVIVYCARSNYVSMNTIANKQTGCFHVIISFILLTAWAEQASAEAIDKSMG